MNKDYIESCSNIGLNPSNPEDSAQSQDYGSCVHHPFAPEDTDQIDNEITVFGGTSFPIIEDIVAKEFHNNSIIRFLHNTTFNRSLQLLEQIDTASSTSKRIIVQQLRTSFVSLAIDIYSDALRNEYEKFTTISFYFLESIVTKCENDINQQLPNVKRLLLHDDFHATFKMLYQCCCTRNASTTKKTSLLSLYHCLMWAASPEDCLTLPSSKLIAFTICREFHYVINCFFKRKNFGERTRTTVTLYNEEVAFEQLFSLLMAIVYPFDGELLWTKMKWTEEAVNHYQIMFMDNLLKIVRAQVGDYFGSFSSVSSMKKIRNICDHFNINLTKEYMIDLVTSQWAQDFTSCYQLPTSFITTKETKIYSMPYADELIMIPGLKINPVWTTNISADVVDLLKYFPTTGLEIFLRISNQLLDGGNNTSCCYCTGIVKNVGADTDTVESMQSIIEYFVNKFSYLNTDVVERLVKGSVALFELFGTTTRTYYCIRILRDILLRGFRKKVIFCHSAESNHGKTSFARVLEVLFGESNGTIGFTHISEHGDNGLTKEALRNLSGKMCATVDEVKGLIDSNMFDDVRKPNQQSSLCAKNIRILTGNGLSCAFRKRLEPPSLRHYNVALFVMCNSFPLLTETDDAMLYRLFNLEFPTHFEHSKRSLDSKIDKMNFALQFLILGSEMVIQASGNTPCDILQNLYNNMKTEGLVLTKAEDAKEVKSEQSPDYTIAAIHFDPLENFVDNFLKSQNSPIILGNIEQDFLMHISLQKRSWSKYLGKLCLILKRRISTL